MYQNLFSNKNKKAFTLVEVLVIVFIIALLAVIILSVGVSSGRDKAAINSYKTTMNSVQAALELCGDGHRLSINMSGINDGSNVCDNNTQVKYPLITEKCGTMTYSLFDNGHDDWGVMTDQDCKGCRIICTPEGCEPSNTYPDCY